MNKALLAVAAAAAMALLASCVSTEGAVKMTPDEKAIARGVAAWNEKEPAAARPFWNAISVKTSRDQYVGYVDGYADAVAALSEVEAQKSPSEAKLAAAFEKARASRAALPKELNYPPETKARAVAVGEARMRSLISAGKLTAARDTGKAVVSAFGATEEINAMNAEVDVLLASRKREADVDETLQAAKSIEDFDQKIAAFESAAADYGKAESALNADAGAAKIAKAASVVSEASKLRKKRQDVSIEVERVLRERAYTYKDRIGEVFARQPETTKTGILGMEELLKHYQGVRADVNSSYKEMKDFAAKYPKAIDQDMMDDIAEQTAELDAQIAKVDAELRTAKEIASRGKVAMPIMIGLFNPVPGTTEEAKRSRPALFSAKDAKKNEYWWGMVSIPKGKMNDLVVTEKTGRVIRVFSENTKSGTLIEKNGLKDLVNRGYKVGNSWPVLNAGSQLSTDKYFFEVQKGASPEYEGDVVVYNSFIARQR